MKSSSSNFVKLLQEWNTSEAVSLGGDWIDQLSRWLGPLDAITLSVSHQLMRDTASARPSSEDVAPSVNLDLELRNVRADLLKAIGPPQQARSRDMRTGGTDKAIEPMEGIQDYSAYRQRYAEFQRRVEWRVDPLRTHCRRVLSESCPRLHKLAELDATLEHIFAAREKAMFNKIPAILERRFLDRQSEYLNTLPLLVTDDPEQPPEVNRKTLAWVYKFEQDFHAIISAELDARLEPIAGMIEAYGFETLNKV
jgi:hypothetical protein